LDDYPRAPASHTSELHVDLLCWVLFYAKTLHRVAEALNIQSDVDLYTKDEGLMMNTLEGVRV
jgi:mannosyl-oligosaccharide glucosidase